MRAARLARWSMLVGWAQTSSSTHSHSSSPILTLFSLEIGRTQATRPFSPHSQPRLWMQADKQILCRFLASPNIKQECHLICKKVHSPSILFLSHLNIEHTSTWRGALRKQARKPRSCASLKLRPSDLLTYSLTRVKSRATSVAKKFPWINPK